MKTLIEIRTEFGVQWQRARAAGLEFLPERFEIDSAPPAAGYDGEYVGIVFGAAHFRFSLSYAPPLGVSWSHRYLHEIGHAVFGMLRSMSADPFAADTYLRTRHWAWRYRGAQVVPGSWQQAQAESREWATLPNEMWAESVMKAIEPTESERTMNYGQSFPANAIAFFIGLYREVSPKTYPVLPGEHLIAKGDDDSLLFYETDDRHVIVRNRIFQTLGKDVKFW